MMHYNSNALTISFLFFFISSSSLITAQSATRCDSGDRKALLSIYNHLGGPPELSSWHAPGVACCNWGGVFCYMPSNRINTFGFRGLNISGTIPPAIADLSELLKLVISGSPGITGTIPLSFTKLKKILYLDLSRNSLSGPIPDYLSQLTTLSYLDLSFNKFSGSIPPSLSKLNSLAVFALSHNQLNGPIPDFTFSSIDDISLSNNKLSGPIPASLAGLGWSTLDLSYNKLSGDASFLFGSSNPAVEIHLQHNRLKFDLSPVSFPVKLMKLELNNNYIYGSIPAQINQVTKYGLTVFNVSYNLLCGQIPQGVVMDKFGVWSFIHNKCLCGKPLQTCK